MTGQTSHRSTMTVLRRMTHLSGFLAAPLLATASPFLVLPSITASHGAAGWAIVAVALSVGGTAAVIAELGWGVVGPQRVGRDPQNARTLFASSLATRLAAVGVLLPVVAGVSAALAAADRFASGLIAAGVLLSALSPAWYLIGLGRPWTMIAVDAVPRCAAAVAAAVGIAGGAPLWTYGALLVLAATVSFVLTGRLRAAVAWPSPEAWASVPSVVRAQTVLIVARGVSTTYTALPTALVSLVVPGAVPAFAAADKLVRMGLSVVAAVPSTLQRWIGHPEATERARRARRAILLNAGLGVVCGSLALVALPIAADVVFSGTLSLGFPLVVANAVLAALVCTSRGLGLALVAHDRARSITGAVVIAATVGTAGTVAGAIAFGAVGAVVGLCIAEACALVVQLNVLRAAQRRTREGVLS